MIVGPTAVGKSALALSLAQEYGGEIVSADSRQVYRLMDVGTAKPALEEQALVPHHLIDMVNPDESYTLAHFQSDAYRAIDSIIEGGRLPLLVGGTGLYVRAVVQGVRIPSVAPQPELRQALEAKAKSEGIESVYAELSQLDPVAAERIDPRNVRRVIRAIEVCRVTGRPFSAHSQSVPPPYQILTIGLTTSREALYASIDRRVDSQVERGLIEENKRLVELGYRYDLPSMSGLGYRQIGLFLEGKLSLEESRQLLKFETHRFARQQSTWFRLADPKIAWLDRDDNPNDAARRLIDDHFSRLA